LDYFFFFAVFFFAAFFVAKTLTPFGVKMLNSV